jgi:hypothetical protein
MNLRKKIYILQNYFNDSGIYYSYSNVYRYDNIFIENCNDTNINNQFNNIKNNTHNSINRQTDGIYLTFGVGFTIYTRMCGVFVDCDCNMKNTSKILNPKINDFIGNINNNNLGIIALAYINSDLTSTIIFKNNLQVDQKIEFIVSIILILYIFAILCISLKYNVNKPWLKHILLSCSHTTFQIIQMYYYLKISNYKDFNTKMNSRNIFSISILLFGILTALNISFFLYKQLRDGIVVFWYHFLYCWNSLCEPQGPNQNSYPMENINNFHQINPIRYIYKNYRFSKFEKYIFIFLTIYGNCNHIYRMVYTPINGLIRYNYTYVYIMRFEMVIQYIFLLWNILMIWLFYVPFVIPFILIDCIIMSLIIFVLKIESIILYSNIQ